jgi:hypothetical protein
LAKKKKQADHRADTRGRPLSGLPHVVADSEAYLALTPFERAVLGEILRNFNGYNNGAIVISYEQMGRRLKGRNAGLPNNGRIGRAVAKLVEHGLLAEPTPASWLERRAREYRLTFISSGKNPPFRSATNEYLSWRAREQKKDGNAALPTTHLCDDARSPEARAVGDPASSAEFKIRSFASSPDHSPGDAGSPLIVQPYPPPNSGGATVIPVTRSGTGLERNALEKNQSSLMI